MPLARLYIIYPISPPIYIYIYTHIWRRGGTKSSFIIFSKNSFRNNLHAPFFPILIPNTSYVKILIFYVGGSQGVPELKNKFNDI